MNWRDITSSFFAAAEITFNKSTGVGVMDDSNHELLEIRDGTCDSLDRGKDVSSCGEKINSNHIQIRLQHLELELASALRSLTSKSDEFITQKVGNLFSYIALL